MYRLTLVVLLCTCSATFAGVVLQTRLGEIEGQQLATPTGRKYYSYTAVPYAKPPIGRLRLKNPVSYGSWPGKLDATKAAPECPQIVVYIPSQRNITLGQEDCLYLNVYTPTKNSSAKLPVLVYVHGGGFRCGNPGPPEAPTNFMEEDVVLVTINYRLGFLGFLSTEDAEIPGNFGLKDQALAIKWIHNNIDQFSGDPSSMIVFGESAGGASAHFLITSPLSRDYLQGGIAESGFIDTTWSLAPPGWSRKLAERAGRVFGCNVHDNFLECLQKVDIDEIKLLDKHFMVWDFDPSILFRPLVEVENEGAFMTEDPKNIKVQKPLIAGIVTGEGIFKTASVINQEDSVLDEFVNNIDDYLAMVLIIERNIPNLPQFIATVKRRYFKNLNNRQDVLQGLGDVFQDFAFTHPFQLTLNRHSGPSYGYVFHHRAANSFADLAGPKKLKTDKPCHADELFSLFNWTSVFPGTKVTEEDKVVSKKMVKLWTNFAKYLNPTPEGSSVIWNQYSQGKVFHIGTKEDHMGPLDKDDVINFWNDAYKIINPTSKEKQQTEL